MVTIIFQNSYATPLIRLSMRLISDLKVTYNYLSDLNQIFYSEQLEDGEYNVDNYFSKFLCHALNQAITQGNQVTYNHLSDVYEIFIVTNWRMANAKIAFILQI